MKHTLFALQIFLPLDASVTLRQHLVALLEKSDARGATYADKRAFYDAMATALRGWSPYFEHGVWDYREDSTTAQAEFEQWCKGTRQDAEDAEERVAEDGGVYRAGGTAFMFVTFLFLLRKGGTSDRFVCELCRMDQGDYWKKATFGRLVAALPELNFQSIRSDAVFVRPGRGEHGVTTVELAEPYYGYLRKLAD